MHVFSLMFSFLLSDNLDSFQEKVVWLEPRYEIINMAFNKKWCAIQIQEVIVIMQREFS